jgi:hypothetical protein
MGGLGSGRDCYATTPAVEKTLHLDADELTDGVEYPGATGRKWWGDEDDPTAELTLQFKHPNVDVTDDDTDPEDVDERATRIQLEYTIAEDWSRNWTGDESHPVELDYTECHFGSVRPWFWCPNQKCRRRVRKLYFPRGGRYWLCRECYDLQYQSSRKSGNDFETAELRYRRAFQKADAENRRPHPNNPPFSPKRPKGMHHDTYTGLVEDVDEAHAEWSKAMDDRMRELSEHYRDTVDRYDLDG